MGLWDAIGRGKKETAAAGSSSHAPARSHAPHPKAHPPAGKAGHHPAAPAWAPRIDPESCRACGSCLDACPEGVFSLGRHDKGARVARPGDCVASCDRCAVACPEEGITFPGRAA